MATDQGDGQGGQRRPTAPGVLRVGPGARARDTGGSEPQGFPPGVGLNIQASSLDVKALSFVSVEPSTGILELRDRKNVPIRVRRAAKDASPYMLDVGPKGQVRSIAMTDTMATELLPLIVDAVQRAQKDPLQAKHIPNAMAFVEAMAKLAKFDLGGGDKTRPLSGKGNETATGFSQNQKDFAGKREGIRAPPAIPETANARPMLSTDALSSALTDIDCATLQLSTVNVKQGFVELHDAAHGRVSIQQTKYTPPPQFTVEFQVQGRGAFRKAVTSAMAREFAGLIQHVAVDSPLAEDMATAKSLLLYTQALLKVP